MMGLRTTEAFGDHTAIILNHTAVILDHTAVILDPTAVILSEAKDLPLPKILRLLRMTRELGLPVTIPAEAEGYSIQKPSLHDVLLPTSATNGVWG